MKKLFLLLPAMLLTLAMNADPIPVSPGNGNLQAAISSASAGAVLELSTGIYTEDGGFSINKNITIQAAEGAHPVIAQKYYIQIEGGAAVTFQGIKFDGGLYPEWVESEEVYHAYNHCLRAYGSTAGTEIVTLDNCEFTRYPSYIIYTQNDTRRWNAITIRNCYFHNNVSYAIYMGAGSDHQSCNSLTIENSTFADVTGNYDVIYYDAPDEEHTTSLTMNHCTFYNHPKRAVYWQKSTNLNVTNCIFAQPSAISYKSVECVGGTITNCLSYQTGGYSSAATQTDCIAGNPYFVNTNLDNYDLSVASFSPAHNAGTDDETLGDYLRWTSDDSAHPTTINISAGTDAIKAAVEVAWPGDEIVLAAGTYEESDRIPLDKNITIKAAEGASVTIKPHKDNQITNGAKVKFINIKFDGSEMSTYEYFIRSYDATAGKELRFEGCEMTGFAGQFLIHAADADRTLDSVIINNCKCINNGNDAIYIGAGSNTQETAKGVIVKNSTFAYFAHLSHSVIEVRNYNSTQTPNIEVKVDHCTFYNNPTSASGYADVRVYKSTKVAISNCIFAHPAAYSYCATYCYGGTINNCLTYNYAGGTKGHRSDDIDLSTCLPNADPLFIDAANSDFHIPCNWSTGVFSPALGAATDGSDLGDPRWYMDEVIPTTNLASAYDLLPTKAKYAGTVEKNASDKIHFTNTETVTNGEVKWKLKITRLCHVSAVVDVETGSTSGRLLTLTVKDADGNTVATLAQASATYNDNDINLGSLNISEEGDYTFILTNSHPNSGVVLEKITLAYFGGDTQTITNTANFVTDIDDAYFSSNGTRADGKISFPGSTMASAWVRWNVHVSNNDYYDVTVNFDKGDADHNCGVKLYNDLTTVFDKHATTSEQTGAASPIRLGRFYIPEGDYIMEFTNPVTNSKAKLISVEAQAFDAPVIALPNTLPAASAITSELAYEEGGELYFTPEDKRGHILEQWAKWKVSVATAGEYLFTMNVTSTNEQSYVITILDSENSELQSFAKNPGSGNQTIKHYFNLAVGNYFVMVQNTTNHSDGHMVSIVVSQPELVTLDEAATSNSGWADKVGETTYDVQIIRTIKAGMYNTFCLPFAVSSSQCKEIFGADVQIRTLESATIEEGDYVLNLNFHQATDIYQGTPVLIRTSQDIVDPVFIGVQFAVATPSASTGTNANFVGNFVAGTILASENNLFMGANNILYFPTVDTEILGMRAYFIVHDVHAHMIKRARIVENEQTATGIEETITNDHSPMTNKIIRDGQLIIVRDGVHYNALGIKLQ